MLHLQAEGKTRLRDVTGNDLPIFFEHQRDPEANRMAAFLPRERELFMAHWEKILADRTVMAKTIVVEDEVAGNIVSFEQAGRRLVGYWIGRKHWGKGIATSALSHFLHVDAARPLHAYVAKHNRASARVLENCGFEVSGEQIGAPGPDGEEVEEFLMVLTAAG
ncbi:MAG TPA: GNAT family N-acetyltransferase [Thermoanaerobaculia bacterium]|nr:GNAT family N-acetyltransferase [Thermoanaerobaculia bacterium]